MSYIRITRSRCSDVALRGRPDFSHIRLGEPLTGQDDHRVSLWNGLRHDTYNAFNALARAAMGTRHSLERFAGLCIQ